LNFSIPPCEKSSISIGFIGPIRVKIIECNPNSLRSKELKKCNSKKLIKLIFLAHKILQTQYATREKNFYFNFEHYDLTIGEEFKS